MERVNKGQVWDFVYDLLEGIKPAEKRKYKTYILKDTISGLYKIGRALDVNKRIKFLSVANPNLEIYHIINKDIETALHRKYSPFRIKSEWFKLSETELEEIKSL